jgi:cysteinyl-tRNA synthetase
MKGVIEWARAEGREISPELLDLVGSGALSDSEIDKKVTEMEQARRARKFNVSDALRAELTAAGIIVENTKDGVRWRRK